MRSRDLFGKKHSHISIVYLLLGVFVIVVGGYFLLQRQHDIRMETLKQEQIDIQRQINQMIASSEVEQVHQIGEIISELPNLFNQVAISNDITLARNLAGLTLAESFNHTITDQASSPFTTQLPQTVKFVSISIQMVVDEPSDVLLFIDTLLTMNRIYYLQSGQLNVLSSGKISASLQFFTFYNDVDL